MTGFDETAPPADDEQADRDAASGDDPKAEEPEIGKGQYDIERERDRDQ
jgi:hypothetical protein